MPTETSLKYPVIVEGHGPTPCPFMVIGEAPGRNEIEQGTPFCGRSGDLLDAALEYSGISREEVYVTNIFKGDVGVGNPNPTPEQIEDHREYLRSELRDVAPMGILLTGRVATGAFLPELGRMADVVGTRKWAEFGGSRYHVYPSWHPAFILRQPQREQEFLDTVQKFVLVTGVIYSARLRD